MPSDVMNNFALCALVAGCDGLDDYIDFEPHNPLLDEEDDDPTLPDLTAAEAAASLSSLVSEYSDILVTELPSRLPPNRPVQHSIDLLDNEKKIRPRVLPLPTRYVQKFRAQLHKFVETGYWAPAAIDSACSMFAVPKHGPSQGRFVINLRPRNENTRKRISPVPDMKGIRSRVASNMYRSKLDFKMAYEQIRLWAESVSKSGFVTPLGTYVSRVMQQGDTNAPDTMHRVCNMMFAKSVGRFLEVFYDDVFIYSQTRRAHLRYLRIILSTLCHYKFYLSKDKGEFMADSLKALGCIINNDSVHVDPEQWDAIKSWPTLSPLIPDRLESGNEELFVFSDASILGCGSWIGQGTCRKDARPYRYHSAKFNNAQRNYTTTDQELLGVLDACLKFRELITGWEVTVVTDHLPLRTYWDHDPKLTRQHVRLWETLSQFSLVWSFIPGHENTLADSLSRLAELCAEDEWLQLPVAQEPPPATDDLAPFASEPSARMVLAMLALTGGNLDFSSAPLPVLAPLTITRLSLPEALQQALIPSLQADSLSSKILAAPDTFPTFSVSNHLVFRNDGDKYLLYLPRGTFRSDTRDLSFRKDALQTAHDSLGHLGPLKVLHNLRRSFWWAGMHKDTDDYVQQCEICARNKSSTAKPYGLLHPLDVPSRPWQVVGMDLVVGLPPVTSSGVVVDSALSVTDFLTKMVVLIPLPSTSSAEDVAQLYHDYVFKRFGLQEALVSDRDPKFTSRFWRAYQRLLDVSLRLSSSAHPQTDGRSEVTNEIVGQVLRSICEDAPEDWAQKLPLVEFALNSNVSTATGLAPFEALYDFLLSSWPKSAWTALPADKDVSARADAARLDWLRCSDALIATRVDMIHHANKHRRPDSPTFQVGNLVYLSTAGLRFPQTLSSKFIPRYIGPYAILAANPSKPTVDIDLPPHLRIHARVHTSKLRPHFPNDAVRFPSRTFAEPPALLAADGAEEWLVEKLVGNRVERNKREFRVRYLGYSAAQDEWRPEVELRETAPDALDDYLSAQERRAPRPRRNVVATLVPNPFHLLSTLPDAPLPSSGLDALASQGGVSARI
ncbi:hypothetical protein JCM11641_002485 [Rhodosporidiobolus odoratus]